MRRFLIFALLCAPTAAWSESGRTGATFLQRTLGAQAGAMGQAFAGVRGRADIIQYNPAGISTLKRRTVTSTYLNGFAGVSHGYLAYAHPIGAGAIATSLTYFDAGAIELNLSDGTTGRVSAERDTAWTLSYAHRLPFNLHVGATYRFLRLELAETARATSSQGDMGVLWESPIKGLSFGGALQYFGPDIKFEEVGDPPPKTMRYGFAWRFPDADPRVIDPSVDLKDFDMLLTADYVDALHERPSPRLGAEFGLTPHMMTRVALRTGWVVGRDAENFTFGLGVRHKDLLFDYAFGRGKDLGNLFYLTLTLAL
jgi:hypothetical protein